ncbi:MAG TPA: hypothetical protein VK515_06120 [Rhizomicrobium sp.]|nr:hypothetical protein [Rhizomicrobium sp.]
MSKRKPSPAPKPAAKNPPMDKAKPDAALDRDVAKLADKLHANA